MTFQEVGPLESSSELPGGKSKEVNTMGYQTRYPSRPKASKHHFLRGRGPEPRLVNVQPKEPKIGESTSLFLLSSTRTRKPCFSALTLPRSLWRSGTIFESYLSILRNLYIQLALLALLAFLTAAAFGSLFLVMNFIFYIMKDVPQDFILDLNSMFCAAIAATIPYFMKHIASAVSYMHVIQ